MDDNEVQRAILSELTQIKLMLQGVVGAEIEVISGDAPSQLKSDGLQ